MNVIAKQNILNIGFITDEERAFLLPGTVFKVMLHEIDSAEEEWYLIEVPINRNNIYISDGDVEQKSVTRFYRDPGLPYNYEEGPFMWIESSNFKVVQFSTNKEAKSFLKNYDWHLD